MSNCIIFALGQWLRHGGYVSMRRSHYGWWPHFLWSPDLATFYDYTPVKPNHHLLFPPIVFRGKVRASNFRDRP